MKSGTDVANSSTNVKKKSLLESISPGSLN